MQYFCCRTDSGSGGAGERVEKRGEERGGANAHRDWRSCSTGGVMVAIDWWWGQIDEGGEIRLTSFRRSPPERYVAAVSIREAAIRSRVLCRSLFVIGHNLSLPRHGDKTGTAALTTCRPTRSSDMGTPRQHPR